jgi:hypothetical protein
LRQPRLPQRLPGRPAEGDAMSGAPIESRKDLDKEAAPGWAFWNDQLKLADKDHKVWETRGEKVTKRYRDESRASSQQQHRKTKGFNILWSNVETLKPAIYFKPPVPAVDLRWKDRSDPLARTAATVLERALVYSTDAPGHDVDYAIKQTVEDLLLPGRGVLWVRYCPSFGEEQPDPADATKTFRPVAAEETAVDYVHWKDFRTSPARHWAEVTWIARRAYMTRDELIERFGEEKGRQVTLDYTPSDLDKDDARQATNDGFKKAVVWEIWDKSKRKVAWFAAGYKQELLDESDPPLKLRGFFPVPRPLTGVTTTDKILPIPEFALYQDQADELDDLTARINKLAKAVKAVGVRDSSAEGVERLLQDGCENVVVPVKNWAVLQKQSGGKGLPGVVSFLPLKEVVEALAALYKAREATKLELYEITGIADIIRGQASGPVKTATEQRIKGQFATLRLQERQKEVQRFIRDLLRVIAEVIAENFSPQTLASMTGVDLPTQAMKQQAQQAAALVQQQQAQAAAQAQATGQPPAPPPPLPPELQKILDAPTTWEELLAFFKSDELRSYRIDIETDSTIAVDEQADKEAASEFLTSVTAFMERALPMVQQIPQLLPLASEALMFVVRRFRAGRSLEAAFEQAMNELKTAASQPREAPKDPKLVEAEAKMMLETEKQKTEAAERARKLEMDAAERARKMEIDAENERAKLANEARKLEVERDVGLAKAQADVEKHIETVRAKEAVDRYAAEQQNARETDRVNREIEFKRTEAEVSRGFEKQRHEDGQKMEREKAGLRKVKSARVIRVDGKLLGLRKIYDDGSAEDVPVGVDSLTSSPEAAQEAAPAPAE